MTAVLDQGRVLWVQKTSPGGGGCREHLGLTFCALSTYMHSRAHTILDEKSGQAWSCAHCKTPHTGHPRNTPQSLSSKGRFLHKMESFWVEVWRPRLSA